MLGILKNTHITEKTSSAASENKYVFSVSKNADKKQIKQDVEAKFGVAVERVNVINLPDKERRRGGIRGWKPGIKKAIVKLKEGEKIEMK